MIALALTFQDPQWAATVRAAGETLDLRLAPGLTGAQHETCVQTIDRIGYLEGRMDELARVQRRVGAARASAEITTLQTPEGREWHETALAVVDQVEDLLDQELIDARRAQHTLMSVNLAFCLPRD